AVRSNRNSGEFRCVTAVVCLGLCCLALATVRAEDRPRAAAIGKVLRSAVEKGVVAGAVVHVSQAGRPLGGEAYGEVDRDRPMNADAIFRIASMTKPITSVGVMM